MEGKDNIKDLFSQKLANYEVPVNPELWSSIASQLPTAATAAASTGISLATKIIIGLSVAASIATGIFFMQNGEKEPQEKVTPEATLPVDIDKKKIPSAQEKNEDLVVNTANKTQVKISDIDSPQIVQDNNANTIEKDLNNEEISIFSSEPFSVEKTISQVNKTNSEVQREVEIKNQVVAKEIENKTNPTIESPKTTSQNITNLIPKESSVVVNLPNVFTPNGDGANDYLELKISDILEFSVVMLNDLGEVIFQSQETDFKWDGIMQNGDKAPRGTYVYYVTGKDSEGKLISKHSRLFIQY